MHKKLTLATQCVNQLEDAILNGTFLPGQRLRNLEVKEFLQTGLSPVREAMAKLAERGLLLFEENKGYSVVKKNITELLDCMRTFEEIESLCLRLAIENGGNAWEAAILASLHKLKRVESKGTFPFADWEPCNKEFFSALASACPYRELLAIREKCWSKYQWYQLLCYRLTKKERTSTNFQQHQLLADLALKRSYDRADKSLRQHITASAKEITEILTHKQMVEK